MVGGLSLETPSILISHWTKNRGTYVLLTVKAPSYTHYTFCIVDDVKNTNHYTFARINIFHAHCSPSEWCPFLVVWMCEKCNVSLNDYVFQKVVADCIFLLPTLTHSVYIRKIAGVCHKRNGKFLKILSWFHLICIEYFMRKWCFFAIFFFNK